jgi:hypothetical protein
MVIPSVMDFGVPQADYQRATTGEAAERTIHCAGTAEK